MYCIKRFCSPGVILVSLIILFAQSPVKTGDSYKDNIAAAAAVDDADDVLSRLLNYSLYPNDPVIMEMEITAYCTGPCCNSKILTDRKGKVTVIDWSNRIAAGSVLLDELNHAGIDVVAVDTDIVPFGSIIRYDGKLYAALDRGGLIKGARMDIAMMSHAKANNFGRKKNQQVEIYYPTSSEAATQIMTGSHIVGSR